MLLGKGLSGLRATLAVSSDATISRDAVRQRPIGKVCMDAGTK
jgi:hypothetical protein